MNRWGFFVCALALFAHPLFAGQPGPGAKGEDPVAARKSGPTTLMRRDTGDEDKAGRETIELTRRGEYAKWRVQQFGGNPSGKHRIRPGDAATIMRVAAPRTDAPKALSLPPFVGQSLAATLTGTFTAIGDTGSFPPDPAMAAGPYNVVASTNGAVSIFKKNGTLMFAQALQGFVGATDSTFDPKVMYDPYINRFWVIAVSKNVSPQRSNIQVALSDTDDATGTWTTFPLNVRKNGNDETDNWCDYPQMGMDVNHIYFTCNMFDFEDNDFQYSKIRILTKSQFVNNACCTWYDFWDMGDSTFSNSFTVQPARMYGAGPATPMILVNAHGHGDDDDELSLWQITNADNCCSGSGSPSLDGPNIDVGEFTVPHNGRQLNESIRIDSGDTRLLYAIWKLDRLAMGQSSGCDDDDDVCIAYTELDLLHGINSATVVNDWVFGDATVDSYYPQGAVNGADNKAIVYTRSGPNEFAGAFVLGVPSSDVCTNCAESAGQTLLAGANTYVRKDSKDRNRWGDYFGAAPDPDGVGIWIHAQAAGATFDTWQTQVGLTYEPLDTTPPTSTATMIPASVNGWNRAPAFVHVNAVDSQSGPRFVYYAANGANNVTSTKFTGADLFVPMNNEGTTFFRWQTEDKWGNVEGTIQSRFVNIDNTAPVAQCAPTDSNWHADNISVNCFANDFLSGINGDSFFVLTTSVPAGAETNNASTDSHAFCDMPGNCTTAGPIAGNKIDRKAPSISIATPSSLPLYVVNQAVPSSYGCTDGGSGVSSCDGPVPNGANIDTSTPGAHTFVVNASDAVANTSTATEAYNVTFNICLGYDPLKTHKAGAAVPIKVDLCDANGAVVSTAAFVLTATAIVPAAPLVSVGNANPGNVFNFASNGGYLYMLNTKTYVPGNYNMMFTVTGDPILHQAPFSLK